MAVTTVVVLISGFLSLAFNLWSAVATIISLLDSCITESDNNERSDNK